MAPYTINSWVEGLRLMSTRPGEEGKDHDTSTQSNEGPKNEREWEISTAEAALEAKYFSFDNNTTPIGLSDDVNDDDAWSRLSVEHGDVTRMFKLWVAQQEPDLTSERLLPTKENLSKLAPEVQGLYPSPQRPERSGSIRLRPLHNRLSAFLQANLETFDAIASRFPRRSHELSSVGGDRSGTRPTSEPTAALRTWRLSSHSAAFQPRDVPYRISWLWSEHFRGDLEPSVCESKPAASRMFAGAHETNIGHMSLSATVDFVLRSPSAPQPTGEEHAWPLRNRDTLTPDDSISTYGLEESISLPKPPERAHKFIHQRKPSSETVHSSSYSASQSTEYYVCRIPAAVVKLRRISIPPLVPTKSQQRSKKDLEPLSPISHMTTSSGDQSSIGCRVLSGPPPRYCPAMPPRQTIPPPPNDGNEEPLNGHSAWLHACAGFLVVFNCWGIGLAFGLFQEFYQTAFLQGTSSSSISWIGSIQLALVFGLGVPVGRLVDRGLFKPIFYSGAIIMVIGLFSTAWCTKLGELLLVQGLVTGLGMGMCFCSGIVALMTWFDERHVGMAMGLGAAGSCIGGIVYVLIAQHFLTTIGFATTMRILGGVAVVTMLPALAIFRVRGQKGFVAIPDRFKPHRQRRRFCLRSFLDISYILAALGLFFSFLGVYFGFYYIPLYGSTALHLSQTASTNLLIFMLAANLPGRFLPALLSDKCIGPLNTIIPSVLLSSAVTFLWIVSATTHAGLIVIACFYGFVSAGVQVLYAPTMYSFCLEEEAEGEREEQHALHWRDEERGDEAAGVAATDRVGVRAGGIFTCIGVASLLGNPIGGWLISYRVDRGLTQPYLGAQIFAGCCLLFGGILLLGSRVRKAGWNAGRA